MIKKSFIATAVSSILLMFTLVPATVSAADIQGATCQGSKLQFSDTIGPNECQFSESKPQSKVNTLITDIINIFSIVVGIVAVIMIIYGGFRFVTSGGDSGKVTDSRNTILYAVIGLVIVVFAQFIVKFVLAKVTGNSDS